MILANTFDARCQSYFQSTLPSLLAILTSYVALDLAGRVIVSRRRIRLAWTGCGAAAMGIGLWATYRTAMPDFTAPAPASYHWPTSLISLFAGGLSSALILYSASRQKITPLQSACAIIVAAAGVAAAQYISLTSVRLPITRHFDPILVALSLAPAGAFFLVIAFLPSRLQKNYRQLSLRRLAGATIMAIAIMGMHRTAMAAVRFSPSVQPDLSHTLSVSHDAPLRLGIALFSIAILGMTVFACELDGAMDAQGKRLELLVENRTMELIPINQKLEKSEAEARARAQDLESILDAVPGMVLIARDQDCRWVTGNRAAYDLLRLPYGSNFSKTPGQSRSASPCRNLKDGRELAVNELPMRIAAETGREVRDFEMTWIFNDGTTCDTFGNAVPLRDEHGRVCGSVGVFVDMTARNRALAALRESEDRYRDLVEHSHDLLCTHDLTGKILSCNPAAARSLGYEVAELLESPLKEFIAPEFRAQFDDYLARIQGTGEDEGFMVVVTRAGERRIWEYRNSLRIEGLPAPIVRGVAHDVTERKQAERSLRLFRMLIDQSNDAIEVVEPATLRFLDVNQKACVSLGYRRDELVGLRISDIEVAGHASTTEQVTEKLRESKSVVIETFRRRKDGTTFPAEVSLRMVHLERDYYVAITRDITERKQDEERLRASESLYRAVHDRAPLGICRIDLGSGKLLEANLRYCEITGVSEQDLLSSDLQSNSNAGSLSRKLWNLSRADTCGHQYKTEIKCVRPDGSSRWVDAALVAIGPDIKLPMWLMAMVQDITERRQYEEKLREYERVIEGLEEMIIVVNRDYRYVIANRAFLNYRKMNKEQIIGHSVSEVSGQSDSVATLIRSRMGECFQGKVVEYELKYEHAALGLRDMRAIYFPIEGTDGVDRIACILRDITQQKKAEQALQKVQSELARVTRLAALGELTASIAHEINQPLAAVAIDASAALHWLAQPEPKLDEAREAMSSAIQEANHASQVIRRIRSLLKKAPDELRPLNGNDVIRSTLRLAENDLLRAGIIVKTVLDAEATVILGDRVQLQQVILNLILNAIDAMSSLHDWGKKLAITSSNCPQGLLIKVEDSGSGFDASQSDRIFEPFFTTKPSGVGLGLSISRSIIEAHGGRLWAIPGISRGAVFQFTLPRMESAR